MINALLVNDFQVPKARLDEIIKNLHELTIEIKHEGLDQIVSDLRLRVQEPFMFVVVGEVKVGKSSFINALLNSKTDICKVAPSPMTDTIQQIIYGPEHSEVALSPVLKRITYNEEILKEIAIVDTPGTNTIIGHHQEITEKFIPVSDLIVFVFEAKNPYRQSAWDLFKFINEEWRKKIIFVLQQKDLLNENDLTINVKGLRDFAKSQGLDDALIFCVSAKLEQEGLHNESGFAPLREYIRNHITGGKAALLKLLNNIDTCQQIIEKLSKGILIRKDQYEYDVEFRKDIQKTLDEHERISKNNINVLIENTIGAYDKATGLKRLELDKGLAFLSVLKRGISGLFNKSLSLHKWLQEFNQHFEISLNQALESKLQHTVKDISDSIQQMGQIVSLKIRNSKTILKNDLEIFTDIADRRADVMRDLQETFQSFLNNSENYYSKGLIKESSSLGPNVTTGTGIAIVGTMITALTHGAIFDITGGVLTTIGFLFAGVTLGFNKRKIMNQFDREIDSARIKLEHEIRTKLEAYVMNIKQKIDLNFSAFDQLLIKEHEEILRIESTKDQILTNLELLKNNLNNNTHQ
ncbi:MAG: dynamin family protein [Saprospiraceae bacterium]|nr:dynamin family protein [Candidatus Defluviibacterium haderslevense]